MIDLLIQVGYVLLVLAVISLFVCTIPIGSLCWWLCSCWGDPSPDRREQYGAFRF